MTALVPRSRRASTARGLVDAAMDGDELAWAQLWEEHLPAVRRVALSRLGDEHLAEEVVQETLVRAWTRLHQLEDPERLGPWLRTIAGNIAVEQVRRLRVSAPLSAARDVPSTAPGPDDLVLRSEEAAVLHGHLDSLGDRDRTALWQRDAHGVPIAELATTLEMTPGSVRVLLTRARRRLRDGYGLALAPVAAIAERVRTRWAALTDVAPAAVVAPALVVAAVAGITVQVLDDAPAEAVVREQPQTMAAPSAEQPEPSLPDLPVLTDPAGPSAATPLADARGTSSAAGADDPARPGDNTGVTVGREAVVLTDAPPTDDDRDAQAPAPAGPIEGLEVYLEETTLAGLEQACVVDCD